MFQLGECEASWCQQETTYSANVQRKHIREQQSMDFFILMNSLTMFLALKSTTNQAYHMHAHVEMFLCEPTHQHSRLIHLYVKGSGEPCVLYIRQSYAVTLHSVGESCLLNAFCCIMRLLCRWATITNL